MNNLELWDRVSTPPADALKKIGGGNLAGFTDINPQWRYKTLTEIYGPYGVGWKYTVDKKWSEPGVDGTVMAFADISLFVRYDIIDLSWSVPIPGHGGSMLIIKDKNGLHASDEAYKMAITDALSVACKMLGIGSSVYEGKMDGNNRPTGTKYDRRPEFDQTQGQNQNLLPPRPSQNAPRPPTQPQGDRQTQKPLTPPFTPVQVTAVPQTQPQVPSTKVVNQQIAGKPMSDKQRRELGLVTSQETKEIAKAIKKQGIIVAQLNAWLMACYGYPSGHAIIADAYKGILKVITEQPDQIRSFRTGLQTQGQLQRQPGEEDEGGEDESEYPMPVE